MKVKVRFEKSIVFLKIFIVKIKRFKSEFTYVEASKTFKQTNKQNKYK